MSILGVNTPHFLKAYLPLYLEKFNQELLLQVQDLYVARKLVIPAAASSTLQCLYLNEGTSSADIAKILCMSHQLITQHIEKLLKLSIVVKKSDQKDRRRQIICLTPFGIEQATLLSQTIDDAAAIYDSLFEEIGCHIPALLDRADEALKRRSLNERFPPTPAPNHLIVDADKK